ncbi:flavodoxin family protein [Ruicaihuangia caeni]|uniref:Flavodoxin domain-containing protein n=1 Tax=Ruicaihuangia caeni TaxID=3042517 RepID=A0AAW6T8S4_9MICO|nr:flavodoxin domain-containing protein [Klugiella sp. YN-L-19]MDI2099511.1 flavodoxin domain-containing protein [Klugiella sp. YN-L-19]
MTAVVLYESMFGNTRRIAEAIAEGLSPVTAVTVEPCSRGGGADADLVVLGAPTHAHTLPRPESRKEAARWADDPEQHLTLEPEATASGVREWLEQLTTPPEAWAAFGTRVDIPRMFAGDASAGIQRRLRRLGSDPIAESECFVVTTKNTLVDGELERAREWGRSLGEHVFAPLVAE